MSLSFEFEFLSTDAMNATDDMNAYAAVLLASPLVLLRKLSGRSCYLSVSNTINIITYTDI